MVLREGNWSCSVPANKPLWGYCCFFTGSLVWRELRGIILIIVFCFVCVCTCLTKWAKRNEACIYPNYYHKLLPCQDNKTEYIKYCISSMLKWREINIFIWNGSKLLNTNVNFIQPIYIYICPIDSLTLIGKHWIQISHLQLFCVSFCFCFCFFMFALHLFVYNICHLKMSCDFQIKHFISNFQLPWR